MEATKTIALTRSEVKGLLGVDECIDAIEGVFRLYGKGRARKPGILGIHTDAGGFHTKAGLLNLGQSYFVTKTNANFPTNPTLHSLPTIQGVVAVFDGENGRLLALLDSIEISILRTGAATAVAARYLARQDSCCVTISGAGNQGRVSLRALQKIFSLKKVFVTDISEQNARAFVKEMSEELDLDVVYATTISKAVRESDICVTCTPSRQAYLNLQDVKPGTFIAAVGADSEEKQELEPALVASAKLVTDITEQCAAIGELHHAIQAGKMSTVDVFAELGEVVAGKKPGRQSADEIIIFDSTGMALQDVAAAVIVYEKAIAKRIGVVVDLNN